MQFNDSQRIAAEHGAKPMLVIAGPGSGKTTVLTMRVKNLIEKHGVNPGNILVITFTKAAALEMEARFNNLIGAKQNVTFGTFHAIFFKILKNAYNYSVDNIIKDDMKKQIVHQAVERSNLEPEDMSELVENILGEISRVKTEGIDINVYYSANCAEEEFRNIYKYYINTLKKKGLIDFDDMLLYCYELLNARPDILTAWQKRYKYILVDEFQDINKIQYDVVKLLAKPENNLFIVGDDDQSIYGFRGSKPEIMLNFEKDYPDAKRVVLDTNYRSTSNIVNAAGKVICNNKVRFPKNINTVNPQGQRVVIAEFNDMYEQYDKIIDDIKSCSEGEYNKYAVIFRTNSIVAPLARKLSEHNIPFYLKEGIYDVFSHWIFKDFFTYINMALGSRKRSDFLQIANRPKRYISRDYLTSEVINFDDLEKYYEDKPWMIERLDTLKHDLLMMKEMNPYAMINYIRRGIGYDDFLKEYADGHNIDVKELFNVADEIMDSAKNMKHAEDWFDYIDAYQKKIKESAQNTKKTDNCVTLTTMHGSKGLEYDYVYIIDACEGITPYKKAVFDAEIEEERRMFYVAMTRAKKELYILCPKVRYNKNTEPSRFVGEIMQKAPSID